MPYFTTARTDQSRRVFTGHSAEVAVEELYAAREKYHLLLLAFCFMPDHAHFVIVPGEPYTISQTMRIVKGAIARRINRENGRQGQVWQEGFFDEVPQSLHELNRFIAYVHNNPVKGGLCRSVEEYAYSSGDGRCLDDYWKFLTTERSDRQTPERE